MPSAISPTRVTAGGITDALLAKMRDRRQFRDFPNNYLVVDIETTGVEIGLDLIVQVGHCLVVGGQVVDRSAVVLDWTRHPDINQQWLADRLVRVKRHVEVDKAGQPSGKTYHFDYARLANEGVDPEAVLRVYLDWFRLLRAEGSFFLTHNGIRFDGPFLTETFGRYLKQAFAFEDGEMFDTGMVEKAIRGNLGVWPEDSPAAFFKRAGAMVMKGVFWRLAEVAIPAYGLDKLHNLDMAAAHSADFDCYLCHLLFRHYLSQATMPDGGPF